MRTPILAVVALVFGLAAAYGTWHYISTQKPADPEHDVVIVKESLKADIEPNQVLTPEMFEVKKMKQSQVGDPKETGIVVNGTPGRDMTALTSNKRRSKVRLVRGKPIIYDLQTAEPGAFGLQAQLGENEYAYTVQTNQYNAGSGFLRPGMKVDVVVKFKDPNSAEDKVAVMFEDVDVLAVNNIDANPPENQPLIPDRIVLRLSADQSLRMKYFETVCGASFAVVMRSQATKEKRGGVVFDPKGERLFAEKKDKPQENLLPGSEPGKSSSGQSLPPKDVTPPPSSSPTKRMVDRKITFFYGDRVHVIPNWEEQEIAPTGVPNPPAPGTGATKDSGSPGTQTPKKDEPKKDEPKKDEPKKDESRGEGAKPISG